MAEVNIFDYMEDISNESIKKVNIKYEATMPSNLDVDLKAIEFNSLFGSKLYKDYELNLNNKLGHLRLNYAFLRLYYDKGIPDDIVYTQDENTGDITYFPDFKDEHRVRKFWFDYYLDLVYLKLFSAYDSIYHLLNMYYEMCIKPGRGFNGNVIKVLGKRNADLHLYLNAISKNIIFIESKKYRDNLMHNYPLNHLGKSVTIEQKEEANGMMSIWGRVGIGVEEYIKTTQFMVNIDQSLMMVKEIILKLKLELEKERVLLKPSPMSEKEQEDFLKRCLEQIQKSENSNDN